MRDIKFFIYFLSFALTFPLSFNLKASSQEYIYPYSQNSSYSNYGTVGLIQLPSARMQPAGTIAFSWSHFDPYINGSLIAYPFSFLEASYQYTDVNNALYSNVESFSGDQSYKDKGFDFKIQLLKESQNIPAVAVGFRDVAGTALFSSEYFVFSKRFKNIDYTLGIGWGILNRNRIKNPFTLISDRFENRIVDSNTMGGEVDPGQLFHGPAGLFGGIEYIIPNLKGARIKLEYDGTDYTKEGFPYGEKSFRFAFEPVKQPDSRINIGFVYPLNENMHLKLGFIKGNTLNFGFSVAGPWAKKNPVVAKKEPIKEIPNPLEQKYVSGLDDIYLYRSSLKFMTQNKLNLRKASLNNETYAVSYSQNKFSSHAMATGRIVTILDTITPDSVKKFEITNINAGMAMHTAEVDRSKFREGLLTNVPALGKRAISFRPANSEDLEYKYNPEHGYPSVFYKISPELRSQIGGPDGFFFGDLRLGARSETVFSDKITLLAQGSIGLTNNFSRLKLASDSILPHVRTDIVKYLKATEDHNISRLQLNVFGNISPNVYSKFSVGLLEEMFGGVGGEILYRPFYKNYAIGAELWKVKQRDYEMMFDFLDYEITTGHINFYFLEPRSQVLFAMKGGKFLAGDSGINFDFSRRFKSGLRMGAFVAKTDISKFEFGEGSFDKGFYFHVPLQFFFPEYSKGMTSFGLRPLTRDGAAYLNHSHFLWGTTEQAQANTMNRDMDDIYD